MSFHISVTMPEERTVLDGTGNIIFCPQGTEDLRSETPLVLFFCWLDAPESALKKYVSLYHGFGMDVLVIKSQIKQFLWPYYGMKRAKEILDIFFKTFPDRTNLLVHGMSIGAFVYTMLLITSSADKDKYGAFIDRIKCQILDSIVIGGLPKMIAGVAKVMAVQKCFEPLIKATSQLYFYLTKAHTVDFYNRALSFFYNMPMKNPTLVLYSLTDPLCDPDASHHLVELWRNQGRHVVAKFWDKSRHAGLILKPDYYTVLADFLRHVNLVSKL